MRRTDGRCRRSGPWATKNGGFSEKMTDFLIIQPPQRSGLDHVARPRGRRQTRDRLSGWVCGLTALPARAGGAGGAHPARGRSHD
eukprot:2239832-Prymnesium_polylepis.1